MIILYRDNLEIYTDICEQFGITEESFNEYLDEEYLTEASTEIQNAKYQRYVAKCKENHTTPLSKGEWLLKRSRIKKGIAAGVAAAGAVGAGIAYKKGIPQNMMKKHQDKIQTAKRNAKLQEYKDDEEHAYRTSKPYMKMRAKQERIQNKENLKNKRQREKDNRKEQRKNQPSILSKIAKVFNGDAKKERIKKEQEMAEKNKRDSAQKVIDDTFKYKNGLKSYANKLGKKVDELTNYEKIKYKEANGIGNTLDEELFLTLDERYSINESFDEDYLMNIMYL